MSELTHLVCPSCTKTNRLPSTRLGEHPSCGHCKEPLFRGAPVELNAETFDKTLAGTDLPVVVDFWAGWCGPCLSMAPHFERAAKILEPGARLAKLDVDASQEVAGRFGIRSIPTIIAFKGGQEISRRTGAMDQGTIVQWVRSLSA